MADPLAVRPQLGRPAAPAYQPLLVHPRAFTPAQCERIIEYGAGLPTDEAGLEGDGGTPTNDERLRVSRTAWIPHEPATAWIYRRLAAVAERSNRHYRFDLTGFDEDLQFTTYDRPGAFYTWHQDGLDGSVANRKLSLVVQLSDPAAYSGGDLELFAHRDVTEDGADEPADHAVRARGTAVVFPSFEFHRVRPLTAGVRHSLVCWVSGPPFR